MNIKFPMADVRVIKEENMFVWDKDSIRAVSEDGTERVIVSSGKLSEKEQQKATEEQLNDEWYVKHRGIAYNFGAAGINVIGEDAE